MHPLVSQVAPLSLHFRWAGHLRSVQQRWSVAVPESCCLGRGQNLWLPIQSGRAGSQAGNIIGSFSLYSVLNWEGYYFCVKKGARKYQTIGLPVAVEVHCEDTTHM